MRGIAALLLLLAQAPPVAAEGAGPLVRARLTPAGSVTVGEPAHLVVDVLTPTWFLAPPEFPTLEIGDAFVLLQDRSVNLNESIGGASYSGLEREYLVYPMREGVFTVPPVEVTVVYAIDAKPSPPTRFSSKPLSFSASIPAAARGLGPFVSARRLGLSQQLDPRPEGLAVGGALRRTITIEAQEAFGMMLPPLPARAIDGIAAYPDPPRVEDRPGERGEARVARRVESVSYRLLREGRFELPAVEVAWWDVGAKQVRRASLPPVTFSVGPAPPSARADGIPLPAEDAPAPVPGAPRPDRWARSLPRIVSAAAVLCLLAWLTPRLARTLRRAGARLGAARRRRLDSEPAWFRRACRAAAAGHAAETYRALMVWAGRRGPAGGTTLGSIVAGDAELSAEIDRLGKALYGGGSEGGTWSGTGLVSRLRSARHPARREPGLASEGLGPLNPTTGAPRRAGSVRWKSRDGRNRNY